MARKIKNNPFTLPLHKACDTDSLWKMFNYVHFYKGYAYATDAHIAIKVKVETMCDSTHKEQIKLLDGYSIHIQTYSFLMSCQEITIKKRGIVEFLKGGVKGTVKLPLYNEVGKTGKIFMHTKLDTLINDAVNEWENNKDNNKLSFGLNAMLLNNISDTLFRDNCFSGVRIRVYNPRKAILIDNPDYFKSDKKNQERIGIIMPFLISNQSDFPLAV